MDNRAIYQKDPSTQKILNNGVAHVNDDKSKQAMEVLRYELETFVCDGQYKVGLERILDSFLKNIERPQPSVWVSGFYGSGKSHLVKMLRALWVDTVFEDGATARSIAHLPTEIRDLLKELSSQAKRYGGLHAASGTLGSSAEGSVRLALLSIVFKSAGLPEQYHLARFVMWLKENGIYDLVRSRVEQKGCSWERELEDFFVSEVLYEALCEVKPNVFPSERSPIEVLPDIYPIVSDVSNDAMVDAMRRALSRDGTFPLTLIVLDEVQQYIGENGDRAQLVQETVETCSKSIEGKILFIGTGQTAVTGTSYLNKIAARFTIRVELSDSDVEAVIKKVVLAKKPEAISPIEEVTEANLGEISRHLAGTTLRHRQDDVGNFAQMYPVLPVRNRFWENALHVLDLTGTESQLRNQLSMVHKAIQTNLDRPLGNVIPADFLYFDMADKLLQYHILPKKVHEKTMGWLNGSEDEKLMARACGLVFLINKLAGSNNEIGIHATVDTLADLMVEDISAGSSGLRSRLPEVLGKCELLMKVGEEYRIQTEESTAWNDEFLRQRGVLAHDDTGIGAERENRIRKMFGEKVKIRSLSQGESNVSRDISLVFDASLPADSEEKVCVWVRDGWSVDENAVRTDARQAGNQSPTIHVHIPKRSADDLRHQLIEYKAAHATLETKEVPNTPEGIEARAAMQTTCQSADRSIKAYLDDILSSARVFQSGGNEIVGNSLQEMVCEAARNSLQRLYPQFSTGDHHGWAKVYARAKEGSPDALKAVGDDGEPEKNPVCKAILGFIAAGRKGADIRTKFEGIDYGWPRDAVDGGLQVLLVAGLVRAQDERGQAIDPKELDRKAIGKTMFKVESATVTTLQRLQIRKLIQKAGVQVKSGEELSAVPEFLRAMQGLADRAGGDAPRPVRPDTVSLNEIRLTAGNEQLLQIYNCQEALGKAIETWKETADLIDTRLPSWNTLKRLAKHAAGIPDVEAILAQVRHIEEHRQLLEEPDLIEPLVSRLTQVLREELNRLDEAYESAYDMGLKKLEADENWKCLDGEQHSRLLQKADLAAEARPRVDVSSTDGVLETLDTISRSSFADRVAALPARFDRVAIEAAKLLEPKVQFIPLPRRTLKTVDEVEDWVDEVKEQLTSAVEKGPVNVQ